MKPRRENGATLVNPMTSDVCRGSALTFDFLGLVGEGCIQLAMRAERKSPACEDRVWRSADASAAGKSPAKEQGRRRSITLTALPAPDIEIGLRHPVNAQCPGIARAHVIQFTIGAKKFRPALFGAESPRMASIMSGLKRQPCDRADRRWTLLVRTDLLRGAGSEDASGARALAKDCRRPSIASVRPETCSDSRLVSACWAASRRLTVCNWS